MYPGYPMEETHLIHFNSATRVNYVVCLLWPTYYQESRMGGSQKSTGEKKFQQGYNNGTQVLLSSGRDNTYTSPLSNRLQRNFANVLKYLQNLSVNNTQATLSRLKPGSSVPHDSFSTVVIFAVGKEERPLNRRFTVVLTYFL